MSKIIFFDTETTGLDPLKCGMHQLAGEVVVNDEVVDKFDYRINPFKECEVSYVALAISNTKALDFLKYNQEFQVLYMFTEKIYKYKEHTKAKDKLFLATWARDPAFDVKFLKAFFERNKNTSTFESLFWSNFIDVKSLATHYLQERRHDIESFNLASVAKYLGIEVDESKLHSAMYDAYLCRMVYFKLPYTKLDRVKKKLIKRK